MASVEEHYENLLARHYTWMRGDYDSNVRAYRELFRRGGVSPGSDARALDLGAGSGFQSIALADLGFEVVGVDLSAHLLGKLKDRTKGRKIHTTLGDFRDKNTYEPCAPFEIVVCMGDTLPHLGSYKEVSDLFTGVRESLRKGGKLILGFRDYSTELEGIDRAIPVRLDKDRIMTTFLEYEPERVNVHDMVFTREASGWAAEKSVYTKLRLGPDGVLDLLDRSGFEIVRRCDERGFSAIIARSRISV